MAKPGRRTASNPSLATRIQTDPVHQSIIRLVGYLGIPYPITQDDADRLDERFGKENVLAAVAELLDFDVDAKVVRLKPGVRRLCRGVIGPSPEEWDGFYEGVKDAPPNPYRQEIDVMAAVVADAIRDETGQECVMHPDGNDHTRRILGMRPSRFEDRIGPLTSHTDRRLLELLDTCLYELTKAEPRSVTFQEAVRDIGRIAAELQRRDGLNADPPPRPLHRRR